MPPRGKAPAKKTRAKAPHIPIPPESESEPEQDASSDEHDDVPPVRQAAAAQVDKEDDAEPGSQTQRTKRKKTKPCILTEPQEAMMIEWLKANPFMYDKGSKGFKDTQKKDALWLEKANEWKVTLAGLKHGGTPCGPDMAS
jgi:hypothetical protein